MDIIKRIPKIKDWLREDMVDTYIQYINEQMLYKEDYISNLIQEIKRNPEGCVMEYSSGVSGLLYQSMYPEYEGNVTYAEHNPIILKRVKDHLCNQNTSISWKPVLCNENLDQIEDNTYSLIYSFDSLHDCDDIKNRIRQLINKLKPNGQAWIYDLRRDAEKAMLEQVMIGYKNLEQMSDWYLKNFLLSWRASYTIEEVESVLIEIPYINFRVEKENAMTLSIQIIKEG